MLKSTDAKSMFMSTLGLLLITIFLPLFSGIVAAILFATGFKSVEFVSLALALVWLGLLIWLIVKLWKIAPEVGVTPWAFLWLFLPFAGVFIIAMLFLEPLKYTADNKPTSERLPLTWVLIKDSWKQFIGTFKLTINTSVYYLYLGLILGISGALVSFWPLWGLLHIVITIVALVAYFWITVKLFYEVLHLDEGKKLKGNEQNLATKKVGQYIWVGILIFLITAGPFLLLLLIGVAFAITSFLPILGGTGAELPTIMESVRDNLGLLMGGGIIYLLLVLVSWLWIIYKSIQYSQAIPALLADGHDGYFALKESARIVRHRWWGMLWKNQLWGMVISVASFAVVAVAGIILMFPIMMLKNSGYVAPVSELLNQAFHGAFQMLLMPLTFVFIVKLYKAFKKTAVE